MAHNEDHLPLSPEEANYLDYLKNGDDFNKIEIYALAKYWYQKALETGFESEFIKMRLNELEEKIRFERQVITILVIVAAVVIAGAILFN